MKTGANQSGLHDDVVEFIERQAVRGLPDRHWEDAQTVEKGHGRLEQRRYGSCGDVEWLHQRYPAWASIRSVAWVESRRSTGKTDHVERRYYVSSIEQDVTVVSRAIRGHWGVENGLHWVLDVVFGDDQSRVRVGNGDENLHRVKQMALMLVTHGKGKKSIRVRRKQAGWNNAVLFESAPEEKLPCHKRQSRVLIAVR